MMTEELVAVVRIDAADHEGTWVVWASNTFRIHLRAWLGSVAGGAPSWHTGEKSRHSVVQHRTGFDDFQPPLFCGEKAMDGRGTHGQQLPELAGGKLRIAQHRIRAVLVVGPLEGFRSRPGRAERFGGACPLAFQRAINARRY